MATDNVDIFKKIVFRIPSSRKLLPAIVATGFVSGALFYYALKMFAGNLIDVSSLTPGILVILSLALFIIPSLVSGELLHWLLPDYPRRWGYFLALSNQLIFALYMLILSGADNLINAWNILWLGIITVFLSNLLVLTVTLGYSYVKRLSVLSLVQPLAILVSFHAIFGAALRIDPASYAYSLGVLVFAGFMLGLIILTVEFLIGANIEGVTAFWLTSGLLQKRQEELELGYPARPEVQTLEIQNEEGSTRLSIPWIHPGPLEGFGGGQVTADIIEYLNRDGSGFFLHAPSTHKADPAKPEDYEKIVDAMTRPELVSKASRLVKKDYGEVTFYGRAVNGKKIVFLETADDFHYDDYEIPVFQDVFDPEEVVLVDLHNHARGQDRNEVWYNTETAEKLQGYLEDFLELLEGEETHAYSAGFQADDSGTPSFALVEEVDDQKTLLFGIEGNECGPEMQQLEAEFRKRFDEVLPFTTDTHLSIHELSREKQVEKQKIRDNVEKAASKVSDASIGFSPDRTETMKLLGEDYSGLIFSINILVRLLIISLVALYIALVIWIF